MSDLLQMDLFKEILSIESTSGKERELAMFLLERLEAPSKESWEVGDGTLNLLFSWGTPEVVFCSHMDTVPPYIPPVFEEDRITGRGSCDAKGQFFSMYLACQRLAQMGRTGFGLLILSGEETGSFGAKAFAKTSFKAPLVIVGEPTYNNLVSASKGTKSFEVVFKGESFHSGYPSYGRSAVDMFVDFMEDLRGASFPSDPVLGRTTFNVGLLKSDNPQNILSPELSCRVYFRTTFKTDEMVSEWMREKARRKQGQIFLKERGGDSPAEYFTLEGFPTKPVSFGSDAPHLTNFEKKIICGPGSVLVAHRDEEYILISDIQKAIDNYINIYESYNKRIR
ncbi:MAG: M20/M25/M40 family metallo-hydrolase [Bacteroidales bacterium]|nr:M20/M25/M40 family metallo-hydrolase [Bacteroidales bacterium]